jgi:hypothetical protein
MSVCTRRARRVLRAGHTRARVQRAGLEPVFPGLVRGFTGLIRYKVLKNLGIKRRHGLERLLPWPLVVRAFDKHYELSKLPIGWRR